MLAGLSAHSPRLDLRAEVERVSQQDRVAAFETVTPEQLVQRERAAEQELADLGESIKPLKDELRRSREQHDATLLLLDAKVFRQLRAGTIFRYMGKTLVIDHDHGPSRIHLVEGVLTLEPLKH